MSEQDSLQGPPGPNAPPALKYDILSPAFFADPYPTLARMRADDPAYYHPLLHAWVLTRYDDIQRVLRDPGFSNQKVGQYGLGAPESVRDKLEEFNRTASNWVAFMDPPEHTRLRALMARAFTASTIERMRPRVHAVVDDLLAAARGRGELEIIADFAGRLPLLMFSEFMGIPVEDTGRLRDLATMVMSLFGAPLATAEMVEAAHSGVVGYYDYFITHIQRRRSNPSEDMLGKLVEARVDDAGLSDDELVAMCVMLFMASQETTIYLIGNGVHTLLRYPDEARRIAEDPRLVDGAVEELMRYDSPTFATFRRALVDVENVAGATIKAGDFVCNVLCSANRDPQRFPDPDRFDIERADNRHLSFSTGIHTCPGAALSRLEARIAIPALFRALPGLRLKGDAIEWLPSFMMRGMKALPVVWDRTSD